MKKYNILSFLLVVSLLVSSSIFAQNNEFLYGDALPDAPELSERGKHAIGVRTLQLVNKDQVDILNSKGGTDPLYDRKLTVEVWYPANIADDVQQMVTYQEVMGTAHDSLRPLTPFTFKGRAV